MAQEEYSHYRVVGFGLSGSPGRTPEAAWESFHRAGRRRYGYRPQDEATAVAAHGARLAAGTTRRAVVEADVSRGGGAVGRGRLRFA